MNSTPNLPDDQRNAGPSDPPQSNLQNPGQPNSAPQQLPSYSEAVISGLSVSKAQMAQGEAATRLLHFIRKATPLNDSLFNVEDMMFWRRIAAEHSGIVRRVFTTPNTPTSLPDEWHVHSEAAMLSTPSTNAMSRTPSGNRGGRHWHSQHTPLTNVISRR